MRTPTLFRLLPHCFLCALLLLSLSAGGFPGSADAAPAAAPKSVRATSHFSNMGGGKGVFQFSFNQPMVEEEAVGDTISLDEAPVFFKPAFAGEAQWTSPASLTITGYDRLPRATPLEILARPGVHAVSGAAFTQKFRPFTPFPFLTSDPVQRSYRQDGTVVIRYSLNMKTDIARLRDALSVSTNFDDELPFTLKPDDDTESEAGRDFLIEVQPERLGRLLLKLSPDLVSEEGPERIGKRDGNLHGKFVTREIEVTSMFAVHTVRGRQTNSPPWERYIYVETSNDADMDLFKQFVQITPEMDFELATRSGGFEIRGDFISRPRISLTFKKGAPGFFGSLTEDFQATVSFDDFSPRLALDTQGAILSPRRAMRVPLSTINVEKIRATLWQVPEVNIPLMAMGFFDSYQKSLSRQLASRTGAIGAPRNRAAENSLDLAQLAGEAKGVFLLSASDASDRQGRPTDEYGNAYDYEYDEYYYSYGPADEKLVVISDIGLMARTMPASITVWANSISTTEALENARVRVYAANNILLAEGRTDGDGLWHHERDKEWESRSRPAIIVVSTTATRSGDAAENVETPGQAETLDITYLKLDTDLSADDAFDTGGREYLRQGYEAFCFTPRGVFRPGETVDFKILVRDALMRRPQSFPVAWKVISPTGRTTGQGTTLLTKEGGASWKLPLTPSAPTGRYTMVVSLPGQDARVLGSCIFSVEDFQPPRIEVALAADKKFIVAGEETLVTIDAKYLFGAPAAEAPWEAALIARPLTFAPPAWRGYTFSMGAPGTTAIDSAEAEGTLNEEGAAAWSFTVPGDSGNSGSNGEPLGMLLTGTVRVREDGGRWVGRAVSVPWFKHSTVLGYELADAEPSAGTPTGLRVAAVTPEGKAADLASVRVSVDRIQTYYVRSDRGYTQSQQYTEILSDDIALKDGSGEFTFTPPQRGYYRLRMEGGGAVATAHFDVWRGVVGSEDGGSPLIDRVMLSWDKAAYAPGETAKLSVRAPFTGKLLLVLESDHELYRQVYDLDSAEETIEVPVLQAMAPNAYASAWVIRPVRQGETWGAHRAYGIAPLMVNRLGARLDVAISAPGEALPKGKLPVTVTLKDAAGNPAQGEVALAFIDEGLLSLTSFRTPDPFAFFTAKRGLISYAFDLYNALMPLSAASPILLEAGGGAGGDASLLSPMSRKLELLSIFLGQVRTDENGVASLTLDLPEYSGRGRLYAVAASGGAVGSREENVRVARAVTIEATTPRMVAPGDSFLVPVLAFSTAPAPLTGSLRIETEGPLSVQGETTLPLRLSPDASRASIPLTLSADAASGLGVLRLITTIDGSSDLPFEQRIEIPVRPPFPRLTRTGNGIVRAGEPTRIDIGGGFFPGTQRVELSFSDSPGVSLFRALGYLRSYPYGCLEQTTSAAWPYLAAPALLRAVDPEMAENSEYRQAVDYAIRRLLAMQRSDGGFNHWPGRSRTPAYPWGSAYAAHFLTEAKGTGLVPDDALSAALSWLRAELASPLPREGALAIRDDLSTKAYITYILALNGDAPLGWMQFLKDQGSYLSDSARIFLAGAYSVGAGKADALRELGTLPLRNTDPQGWSMESPSRNEALRLLMWAEADPFAVETATLAARVIKDGNDGNWYSTQENGMAVLALGRYTERTAAVGKEFEATLAFADPAPAGLSTSLAETLIARFKHGETPVFTEAELMPPAAPTAPGAPVPPATTAGTDGPPPLSVSLEGDGAAYYSWSSDGVPMQAAPAAFEGIQLARRWELPDGTVYDFNDFDEKSGKKTDAEPITIPHGTKITVTLYLKPEAAFNSMVLVDILPGGFEIENPNLVPDDDGETQADSAASKHPVPAFVQVESGQPFNIGSFPDARTEMRDDRLLLFVDHMPWGKAAFTYTIRAVNKGSFTLPPLMAEAMYDPEIKANTAAGRVVVE